MNERGMLYAAAVLVAGWSGSAAAAATVVSPFCSTTAKISSTTYYSCTGSTHTAVDIGGVACGDTFRAPFQGSYYYRYYGGCAYTCSSSTCNGGAGNYYVVTGSNGWDFRILHINANSYSRSQTCDGCVLGVAGGHVHFDNRQYGTRKSAWYTSAGTTCGSSAYCGTILGYPTL